MILVWPRQHEQEVKHKLCGSMRFMLRKMKVNTLLERIVREAAGDL